MDVNDVSAESSEGMSIDTTDEVGSGQSGSVGGVDPADRIPVGQGMAELAAMRASFGALAALEGEARNRAILWLIDALGVSGVVAEIPGQAAAQETGVSGSVEADKSPRDFISWKKPQSQVERVACLAYYLWRHRNQRHFKTADIAAMNVEAAGQKFGNLSRDMDNADRTSGYLVSAGQGMKQLTVRGEALVEALPDREAVKAALQEHQYRAKRTSGGGRKSFPADGLDE